jgi:hypothetical protein
MGQSADGDSQEHRHEFSVDTACDCGIALSAYVKRLTKEHGALKASLKRALSIQSPNSKWTRHETARSVEAWSHDARAILRAIEGA